MSNVLMVVPIFSYFFLVGIQLYVALKLLRRPVPLSKLILFSIFQSSTILLLHHILPIAGLRFFFISATHMVYHMWLFEVDLFPEALLGYIAPLTLAALGELTLTPLFVAYSQRLFGLRILGQLFDPSFKWTAYLPTILLGFYFWYKKGQENNQPEEADTSILWPGILSIAMVLYNICAFQFATLSSDRHLFADAFFKGSVLILPVMSMALFRYMSAERQSQRQIQYHVKKSCLQQSALRALREERHDFLNELTLISTYVQMEKWEEALSCIAYTAASLSDRYNYSTLPHDAWLTVLDFKQKEAERRRINFMVHIAAEPPQSFMEQRLLPKLITNLVDNAFAAVSHESRPWVKLTWTVNQSQERVLTVANNGPPISPQTGRRIFHGGVTTKNDSSGNSGWGLPICHRIAEEMGASLDYLSNPEETTFILTFPPPSLIDTEELTAS